MQAKRTRASGTIARTRVPRVPWESKRGSIAKKWMRGRCFWCEKIVNPAGRHVVTQLQHRFKDGGTRTSWRKFHPVCYSKFELRGGRPCNPETHYAILRKKMITPAAGRRSPPPPAPAQTDGAGGES